MITMDNIYTILLVAGAYFIGSIPSGYLIARWAGIDDIRRFGSGNIGATNVARFLGIKYFFLIFFLDACKAYFYLKLCMFFSANHINAYACALALLLGNTFSIFLRGTGGKGMATIMGILCAIHPVLVLSSLAIWLTALLLVKNVGIASVITVLSLPCVALLVTNWHGVALVACMGAWIVWRHRDNIRMFFYMVRP